jgi:CheY-like chemotaxis protein
MMGGEIWLESKTEGTDHGTVFRFTMPYFPAPPETILEEEESNSFTTSLISLSEHSTTVDTGASRNSRVLVVDDNIVNLKLAVHIIQRLGYETSTAKNGREAIEMLQSDPSIGLILLDKEMPVMDGIATVQQIRRMEREDAGAARIPVVALTAAAMTGDKDSCLEAGCDGYLTKPVDQRALMAVLITYCGQPTV